MCAKIKQGILGGLSGKIGNVVGSSWKGIAVLKTLPLSVANPQTAPQVANRTAFKQAILDASELLIQVVKPLWDRDAQRQSGYNAWVSSNKQAYDSVGALTVASLVPTLGKLPETVVDDLVIPAAQADMQLDWVDDSDEGEKLSTDIAYVIGYNKTTGEWITSDGSATRVDGTVTITFADNLEVDDDVSAWLMFQGVSAKKIKFKASSDLSNTVQ